MDDDFDRATFSAALLATLVERLVPPLLPADEALLARGVNAYVRDEWTNLRGILEYGSQPDHEPEDRWTIARLANEFAWEAYLLLDDIQPDHGLVWDPEREPCPCGCDTCHLDPDPDSGDSDLVEHYRRMLDDIPF